MNRIFSILLIAALSLLGGCVGGDTSEKATVELYFLSSDQSKMVTEKREISPAEEGGWYEAVVNELIKGPVNQEMRRAISKDAELIGVETAGTVVTVNMNQSFNSGNDIERLWSRYTLIGSFCSLPGVDKVKILVEGKELTSISTGEPLGAMGKDDIILGAPQNNNDKQVVTLYFSDNQAMYLLPESRQVSVKEGESLEYAIVNEIIKGPVNSSHLKTVPSETKLLSAETKEKVCFVNLSGDFISKSPGGSASELLAVYSIVNSLCELEQVDKVQFLIEGKKIEVFGHMIFNETFSENKNILKTSE